MLVYIVSSSQQKKLILVFNTTITIEHLMDYGKTLRYVHDGMVRYLDIMLQISDVTDIIYFVKLRLMKQITNL